MTSKFAVCTVRHHENHRSPPHPKQCWRSAKSRKESTFLHGTRSSFNIVWGPGVRCNLRIDWLSMIEIDVYKNCLRKMKSFSSSIYVMLIHNITYNFQKKLSIFRKIRNNDISCYRCTCCQKCCFLGEN